MKQKLLLTLALWLTLLGSAWAQSNNALHFDGTNDYVDLPDFTTTHDFSQGFTFTAWVKWDAFTGNARVFEIGNGSGNVNNSIILRTDASSGNLMFQCANGTTNSEIKTDAAVVTTNTWHHVAATISSTGVATIYIDGAAVKSGSVSAPNNVTRANNWLGKSAWTADNYFKGTMDEVSIWHKALTQADIEAIKQISPSGNEDKLVAYYNFNHATGTSLTDATTNAKHGTLYSFNLTGSTSNWVEGYTPTPTLSATPTTLNLAGTVGSNGTVNITSNTDSGAISGNPDWLQVSATTGSGNATVTFTAISEMQQPQRTATLTLVGTGIAEPITLTVSQTSDNALHFDGTNDYVQCPALNPEEMTIEAWVYLTETGREQVLFSTLNRTAKTGLELVIDANNKLYALGGTGTGVQIFSKETISPLEMNTWVHIAVNVNNSYGQANATVYINAKSNPLGLTMYSYKQGSNNLILGCSADNGTPNRFFSGKMDEIRVWNKYRTRLEIERNMNKTLTGTEEGLLAYFKCNQGVAYANNSTVTTLTDATAAGNNGTLHGFALSGITSNWVERHATFKLTAQPAELTLPYTQGSSGTVAITSNVNWSIAGIPAWLQASQTTGNGSVSVTFTALSDNTTGAERTAELSITGEGIPQPVTITVTQEHYVPTLTVSKTEITLACHDASSDIINITSDVVWELTNIPAWLQASQTTGSGNASVTFTTKEWNTDAAPRSASLTLSGTGVSQPVTLTATQGGYVPITLSHSTVVLGGNVGNSQNITLTTNKAWQHSKNADWLTVTPGTGNGSAGITLSASIANTASQNRYVDVVFFTADYEQVTLTVYQAPSTATLSAIITKTDGTQYSADNAASLCHAIGNTPLEQVEGIEVTGGIFPAYEWQWLADNRSRLTALTRFIITEGVTEVSNTRQEFYLIFNSSIEHVSIYGITEILDGDFQNFAALSSVNFPTATSIGGLAFSGCSVLKIADFPNVISIGDRAFAACTSLSTVNFPMTTSIGLSVFNGCTSLSTANFPMATSIGDRTFYGCTSLSTANFPTATSIGLLGFGDCTSLSFANFPKAISIGSSAFDGCTSLSNLVLGAVPPATIGAYAFAACPASRNFSIANATGSELTAAYAAYKAAPDGNTTDNLWYGWTIESSTPRQTMSAAAVFAEGGHTLSPVGLMPVGITIPLSVVPSTGYRMVPGTLAAHKTGDPSTTVPVINGAITMPVYDVTVTAAFELQPYAVIVSAVNGTIIASPSTEATMGAEVTLSIAPAAGYEYTHGTIKAHRTGDANTVITLTEQTNGTYTFTMPAHLVTVTAQFEALPQVLTVANVPNGTITATPNNGIVTNTEIRITFAPNTGYRYKENSLRAYKTGDESVAVGISNGRIMMPPFDVTVTAEFEGLPQTLTVATVANGTITATPSEGIVTGAEITLTTNPAAGYKLVENSLRAYKTGNESVAVAIVDGKFTMPACDVTVTAQFEALPQVLTVETVNNGTITATPNEGIVTGTEITLTTNAAAGYKLVENSLRAYKTGDESVAVGISNGVMMPAFDVTVTAEFEGLPQTLTVATVANGTITATPSEGIVTGAEITLTTNAAAGYKLVENSLRAYKTGDESVAVAIVDGKFTMPAYDVTVTAQFEALPQVLTVEAVNNGIITATPSEGIVTDTEISLSTTPAEGYKLIENSLRAYKTGDESMIVEIVDGKIIMPAYDVTVTAEFALSTGIDAPTAATVKAYPNPFTDYVVIESEQQIRRVMFVNLAGQTVLVEDAPAGCIHVASLKPGIYLVKVEDDNGIITVLRLVKQ